MNPVVVVSGAFDKGQRGGIITTHKLVKMLKEKGVDAYVYGSQGDTMPGVEEAPIPLLQSGKFTAIYPEGWDKNHLKAQQAFLWLLHKPKHKYEGMDGIFYFEPAYMDDPMGYLPKDLIRHAEQLKLVDINLSIYSNDRNNRKGVCYVYHKNQQARLGEWVRDMDGTEEWLNVDFANPYDDYLPAIFNSRESFYSFDPFTFYNILAAACGCRSVVHPIPEVSKEEYIQQRPFAEWLCYGLDDIVEDQETKARKALLNLSKLTEQQINNLIKCLK